MQFKNQQTIKNKQITSEWKYDEETRPSEAITGSLMISCEIGQMNSGGQSDGTFSCDVDAEEQSSSDGTT